MKLRIGLTIALAVASSSALLAQGQVSTSAGGTNAPKSAVTFSPSVSSGVHTDIQKEIGSGTSSSTTVGPYVTPALSVDFKRAKVTANLSYELEMSGAQGFGGASDSWAANTYYDHHPVGTATIDLIKNLKLNILSDNHFKVFQKNSDENFSEVYLNPDVEYAFSNTTSLSAGYVFHRKENFDSVLKEAGPSTTIGKGASNVTEETKVNTLNAGVVTLKNKFGEQSLTTYIRAGKRIGNGENVDAKSYRFQTELAFQSPIKELTGALRYRFNVEDQDAAEIQYYNLGRVVASYALTSNWSVDLLNEIANVQDTQAGKKAQLENETYLGATYKF